MALNSYETIVTLERTPTRTIVREGQRGATYGHAIYNQDVYTDRGKLDINLTLERTPTRTVERRK